MKKMNILLVLMVTIGMVGVVSADPTLTICTDTPSTCAPSGTLTVYQGIDATVNPGLHALYKGWTTGAATYEVTVTDLDTHLPVFGPTSGIIPTDPKKVYYGWTPTKLGLGHYRVRATGSQITGALETDIIVSTRPNVVPELSTSILTAAGLIGIVGLVRMRKKD